MRGPVAYATGYHIRFPPLKLLNFTLSVIAETTAQTKFITFCI